MILETQKEQTSNPWSMASPRTVTKDFYKLCKTIDSLSDGQAQICDMEENDTEGIFLVEIAPKDGYYKGGKFKFKIDATQNEWPSMPPVINCLTDIYHPNINMEYDCNDEQLSNICVSTLDQTDWNADFGFDDSVQALLFLFYEPNLDDSLSPLFWNVDDFEENVRISIEGGDIDGRVFEMNYGWKETINKELGTEDDQTVIAGDKIETRLNEKEHELMPSNENDNAVIQNVQSNENKDHTINDVLTPIKTTDLNEIQNFHNATPKMEAGDSNENDDSKIETSDKEGNCFSSTEIKTELSESQNLTDAMFKIEHFNKIDFDTHDSKPTTVKLDLTGTENGYQMALKYNIDNTSMSASFCNLDWKRRCFWKIQYLFLCMKQFVVQVWIKMFRQEL